MKLPIVGVEPYTTVDYPNKMSATFFVRGCNFECPYCHNADIAYKDLAIQNIDLDVLYCYFENRTEWLDAIVLSGGEVLIYPIEDILHDIQVIQEYGYLVGLHTNGYHSEKLKQLIDKDMLGFVGIDFKSTKDKYFGVTGVEDAYSKVVESIKLSVKSGVDLEVRTTVHPAMLSLNNLKEMVDTLADLDVDNYVYQRFQPKGVDNEFLLNTYNVNGLSGEIIEYAESKFRSFKIR